MGPPAGKLCAHPPPPPTHILQPRTCAPHHPPRHTRSTARTHTHPTHSAVSCSLALVSALPRCALNRRMLCSSEEVKGPLRLLSAWCGAGTGGKAERGSGG